MRADHAPVWPPPALKLSLPLVALYAALYSVEAVIWPSLIFLPSIPRGSEHAKHREDVIILRDYSASLNSLFCTIIELRTCDLMPTSGIHIHFFIRVVSRASKPDHILARLQFGLAGQMCRTMKKIAWQLLDNCLTIAWNLNIYDLHFISVIVTKKRVLTKLQSTIDTGPSLNTVSSRFTSIGSLNCLLVSLSVCHEDKKVTFLPV